MSALADHADGDIAGFDARSGDGEVCVVADVDAVFAQRPGADLNVLRHRPPTPESLQLGQVARVRAETHHAAAEAAVADATMKPSDSWVRSRTMAYHLLDARTACRRRVMRCCYRLKTDHQTEVLPTDYDQGQLSVSCNRWPGFVGIRSHPLAASEFLYRDVQSTR